MKRPTHSRIVLAFALAFAMTGAAAAQSIQMDSGEMSGMKMGMMGGVDVSAIPRVPPVAGYAEGQRIFFIHTEVSDPKIGDIMTEMMDSLVPVIPALADAPDSLLAIVYAFTNGIQPKGPRGPLDFQPDVFDHPVGSEDYRPLRVIHLVTWLPDAEPRLLTSAAEIEAAAAANEITTEVTDVVVNMPFLTWPGGRR